MPSHASRQLSCVRVCLALPPGSGWRRLRAALTAQAGTAGVTVGPAGGSDAWTVTDAAGTAAAPDPRRMVLVGRRRPGTPAGAAQVCTDALALGARSARVLAAHRVTALRLHGLDGLVERGVRIAAGALRLPCLATEAPAPPGCGELFAAGATLAASDAAHRLAVVLEDDAAAPPPGLPVLGPDPVALAAQVLAALLALAAGRPPVSPLLAVPAQLPTWSGDTQAGEERLDRALAFLRANTARDLAMGEVAAAVGMSLRHLQRLSRDHLGHGLHEQLLRLRIADALPLLREPGRPVAAVARLVGFAEPDRFTAAFRRILGTTPGRWRLAQAATGDHGAADSPQV